MRTAFDFPIFGDLQLGPYGEVNGRGCLEAKMVEVSEAASTSSNEEEEVWEALYSELSLLECYESLTSISCHNTLANRRKAYRALERATEKVCGVEIGS